MREEFFAKLFLLGGWLGSTDTYKRTMWSSGAGDCPSTPPRTHYLSQRAPRKPESINRLIMAGHEAMLAQWFHFPLNRSDIVLSQQWYATHSATKAFPRTEVWNAVLTQKKKKKKTGR